MRCGLSVVLVAVLMVGSALATTDEPGNFPVVPSQPSVGRQVVLLLKDQSAWGTTSLEDALVANGIAYDVMGSAQIPTLDLTPYAWVIIESNQDGNFYSIYNANLAMFETWINNGGLFELHGTAYSSTTPRAQPPGGVTGGVDLQSDNYVEMPGHPTVQGVPSPYSGTYASHDSYTNFPPGANIICSVGTTPGGNATLAEYTMGAGTVLLTGTTVEYAVNAGWNWAMMLDNMIN